MGRLLRGWWKGAGVAAVLAGAYFAYGRYAADNPPETAEQLPTAVAEVRDITVTVSATGVLQPVRVVEVKSKAAGEIVEMPVELGDRLAAGDLIAQVDTRTLEQELKQARADLQSARTRLEIAQRQYDRARQLYDDGLISEFDLETSEQSFTTAEAALLRAEAAVRLAEERLADATVRAPIAGTIIEKAVEEGQVITSTLANVTGGTTLVRMADLSEMEIRTLVDEIDIGQVRPGLPVESTVEAYPERRFYGTVIKIEPRSVVQQSVTTFPVLSRIDNSRGLLLPGMNADVNIIVHRRPGVLAVPNEAVRTPADAREVAALLGIDAAAFGRMRPATAPPAGPAAVDGGREAGGEEVADPELRGRSADPELRERLRRWRQGGGGGPPDPELRRRIQEFLARRREAARQGAQDPWGVGGRRQPAVVFVLTEEGLAPRRIVAGIRDWEHTEVVAGLEPGDRVVLLPSTSLLRAQEELRQRFARRSVIPGQTSRRR